MRKRSFRETTKLFIFLLFVSMLFILLDKSEFINSPRGFIEQVVIALRKNNPGGIQETIEQNKAKIHSLEVENHRVATENAILKKQLEAPLSPTSEFITANVLGFEQNGDVRYMLVKAGKNNGVREGMPAVFENHYLGKVVSNTPNITRIELTQSKNHAVYVKIRPGVFGVVSGFGEGSSEAFYNLDKVPQKDGIYEDETVVTGGDEQTPADLLIGTVSKILSEDREAYVRALVVPSVNPFNLSTVFIVTKI
jgi:rod shape-determining protein MreC